MTKHIFNHHSFTSLCAEGVCCLLHCDILIVSEWMARTIIYLAFSSVHTVVCFFFVFLFYACFYNRFFLFFSGKIKCFSDKEVVNFKAILCVKAVFRGKRLLQGYKQKDRNSKRKSDGTPIKKLQSPQNILLKGRWSIAKIKRWT